MSDDERKKFDIDNFLKFFKYFFKLQSLLSILIYFLFKETIPSLFCSMVITSSLICFTPLGIQ